MIRVGRRTYKGNSYVDPSFEGFTSILCLTKSSKYGDLGPYVLRNSDNQIMENIWQASKIYKYVPKTIQHYSRYDKTVIWDYPAEQHLDDNNQPLPSYWQWRKKLMNNPYPVRYPVGYKSRTQCYASLIEVNPNTYEYLDYIMARKRIYLPVYCDLVKVQPLFKQLKDKLAKGENLLIIEVDGPHGESMPYYKEKYGISDDFIINNTILVNEFNMHILLNDPKHPFGHGYCLAMSLLDLGIEGY